MSDSKPIGAFAPITVSISGNDGGKTFDAFQGFVKPASSCDVRVKVHGQPFGSGILVKAEELKGLSIKAQREYVLKRAVDELLYPRDSSEADAAQELFLMYGMHQLKLQRLADQSYQLAKARNVALLESGIDYRNSFGTETPEQRLQNYLVANFRLIRPNDQNLAAWALAALETQARELLK